MRVSYEWLKELVDLPDNPQDLVQEFVRTGTEVEAVEKTGAELDKVVTGQVIAKEAHPDSDHLWVCTVDVGEKNVDKEGNPQALQIVCGAQNFENNDKIVVAMVGAVLPGDFKIKKSKLRGVESQGMNCSERELGLGSDHDGIMILPPETPVGLDFSDWYGLSDTVIDCEITPNRPDCLSMCGMAREVSAMLDVDTHIELPTPSEESGPDASELVEVSISDPEVCSRYVARVVRGVKIGPSPDWLAQRVIAAGSRPINNVVDVTNYVMYLTGQPLHAFDLGKLSEHDGKRHVHVRLATDGELLTTLDDVERSLDADMAVITDDGKLPIALAGVMGGQNTEIDESTVDVLLESACFNAGRTSRTSRKLDLMSESSIRFERQVDVETCAIVADVAAALFESCCGATVCPGRVDVYPAAASQRELDLRIARVATLAGTDIDPEFMTCVLTRLGCELVSSSDEVLRFKVPSARPDLEREVDLIEEVIRLWGMDKIEPSLPAAKNHAGGLSLDQRRVRLIGSALRAAGLSETTTYCFAEPDELEQLGMSEEGRGVPVEILRPLVADQSHMRRSMLPGLLRSVAYNLDHGVNNVALYEIGRVFYGRPNKSQPDEPSFVAGVLCGKWADDSWNAKHDKLDFYDAKGVVEQLLATLRITKLRFKPTDAESFGWLQPGRAAEVIAQGSSLGWVGDVHPEVLASFGIDEPVIAFELSCADLLRLAQRELPYQDIPTLPGVEVDLAVVVDEEVTAETLTQRIQSAGGKLLETVQLFDVYRDPVRVGVNKKSMAFSLTYRAQDRTLTSEEVDKTHTKLVEKLSRSIGAEVRS
ncbi:MAG: phenylalanine--tRNA ligase subunit beta [Atopobiaceae bacterium]|nr:phenylalanine--tRNA ligase subunit beta [Atopobiaceae bacterium]